jgi:cytochrome P450
MRDIGLPDDRWFEIDSALHEALLAAPHDMPAARAHAQRITLELVAELDERAETGVGSTAGGLIPHLLASTVDGRPVAEADIVSMLYLLLLGIDPTSTLTATALLHLADNPKLRKRLIAEPGLIPAAADEFLRWTSPVQATSRTVAEDVELDGQPIRAGERVLVHWAAANRDATVFADPDAVDIDRDTGRHLAFGSGAHYCVGAAIVRAMFTVMLEEVLTRLPDYEIADRDGVTWFPDLTSVYGVTALPVRFPPGRP